MSSCPVGVPLIAVNPFQNVAELYDSKMIDRYKTDSAMEIKVWEPTLHSTSTWSQSNPLFSITRLVWCNVILSCYLLKTELLNEFFLFCSISYCRSTLLIYLLLAKKPFVIWKEILKQGTSRLLWVVKAEQERSVEVIGVKDVQLKLSTVLTLPFPLQTWTTRSLMHFITDLTETR